jgi:hypothetical protein
MSITTVLLFYKNDACTIFTHLLQFLIPSPVIATDVRYPLQLYETILHYLKHVHTHLMNAQSLLLYSYNQFYQEHLET